MESQSWTRHARQRLLRNDRDFARIDDERRGSGGGAGGSGPRDRMKDEGMKRTKAKGLLGLFAHRCADEGTTGLCARECALAPIARHGRCGFRRDYELFHDGACRPCNPDCTRFRDPSLPPPASPSSPLPASVFPVRRPMVRNLMSSHAERFEFSLDPSKRMRALVTEEWPRTGREGEGGRLASNNSLLRVSKG